MFRTELTIAPQERQLSRSARVLTVGSCFADSIGERLRLNKVNALVNPFGTVFQPLALAQLLRAVAGEEQDWQQHVVEARGRWQSFDFHSTLGAESPVELLQLIKQRVQQVSDFLRNTDLVVLTLGTAWAYRLHESGELVSNLHKLPANLFEKELLTADEIVNGLAEVHALLRQVKPDIQIVLTVSPVRHIKDTLPLNAVSKSVLRVACHYLSELLPGVSYFPAYELLNDDLRDYRFYANDMLHPSEVAEDYIWERFARAYFDADFGRFRKEWAAVRQSLTHRPLHAGAPEHRTFLDQTRERLERLAGQGVEVRTELRDVQRQLAALPPPRPVRTPEPLPEDDGEERIDIGDGNALPTAALTQPREVSTTSRRDKQRRPDRTPRPKVAELPAEPITEPIIVTESVAAPEVEASLLEEAPGYPAKKKKRRSRGGAKRTARKHAARLAAEQEQGEPEAELVVPDDGLTITDVELTEELPLMPESDYASVAAEAPADEAAIYPLEVADEPQTPTASEPEPLAEQVPAQVRKRGTGPTPKKSKVITKSSQVKRPKRTSLYRATTAPEPNGDNDKLATEIPASAPLISPPILSEMLLERPVVAETVELPIPVESDSSEPAATTSLAKSKRGRPKAKATPAAKATATETSITEVPSPSEAPTTPTKPRRASRAPKATSEPSTRRGRPPGKKTPPATEAPNT